MRRSYRRGLFGALLVMILLLAPEPGVAGGGYPYGDYQGPGSNPAQLLWTDNSGRPFSMYGYYYRNCTDYVAWRLQAQGVADGMTRGLGHAGQWAGKAEPKRLRINQTPAVGSAAISHAGGYGHVAYVEKVEGTLITVSEYNFNLDGTHGTRVGTPGMLGFDEFIHFEALSAVSVEEAEAPAIPWYFTTLEGDRGSLSGAEGTIGGMPAIVPYAGTVQAFYYDATSQALRHAWGDGQRWQFEALDGARSGARGQVAWDVGKSPAAIIFGGTLHVFYFDATWGNLRHAWSGVNGWFFETLDGDEGAISHASGLVGLDPVAVVYGGSLQLFYYDAQRGNLRHAWATGEGWHFENLDGDSGSISKKEGDVGSGSAVVVFNGELHVFYRDESGRRLRQARTTASGWVFQNLDGDSGALSHETADTGHHPCAVVYLDTIQLFYYDATHGSLRHAWLAGRAWHFETLDGHDLAGEAGATPVAVVYGDSLQVFYYEPTNKNLRHAWTSLTQGWRTENLDGAGGNGDSRVRGDVGYGPAAVVHNGVLRVLYEDVGNGNLRMAWPRP